MNILAIDSSTRTLTVALEAQGKYAACQQQVTTGTSEIIIERITHLCELLQIELKDLSLICCTKGPGSFTSLRVGMATAKGLASALAIPVVSVKTLDLYHYPVKNLTQPVAIFMDARKERFYSALFHNGVKVTDDLDASVAELVRYFEAYQPLFCSGPDAELFANQLPANSTLAVQIDPLKQRDYGESLIRLGLEVYQRDGEDTPDSGPLYIRKSDAEEALERRSKT